MGVDVVARLCLGLISCVEVRYFRDCCGSKFNGRVKGQVRSVRIEIQTSKGREVQIRRDEACLPSGKLGNAMIGQFYPTNMQARLAV